MSFRYYIDSPCLVVRGKPSAELADKLEKDEKARVEKQLKRLGPEGLAKVKEVLEKAKTKNDAPIPEKVLTDFPVPDVSSISWIPVQSVQGGGKAPSTPGRATDNAELLDHVNTDGQKLPFFVQFDHVQVRMPLFLSLLFCLKSPVTSLTL